MIAVLILNIAGSLSGAGGIARCDGLEMAPGPSAILIIQAKN
jgi:hypothetical protein